MSELDLELEPGQAVDVRYRHGDPTTEQLPGRDRLLTEPGETHTTTVTAVETVEPPLPTGIVVRLIDPVLDLERDALLDGALVGNPFALKIEGPTGTGSVKFSGAINKVENTPPYAPFGDNNANYTPANLPVGNHGITIEAWTADNAAGTLLGKRVFPFTIVDDDPIPPMPGAGPSGIKMPTTPKAGWKILAASDFVDPIALGSWTGDKQGVLMPRPNAADDGKYKDSSGRAIYSAKKTISQEGSVLIQRLLQETNGQRYAACALLKSGVHPSLRITQCVKVAGPMAGWKMAHLMAVKGSGVAKRGEYDLPEGQFRAGANPSGFIHIVGGEQFHFDLPGTGTFYDWHTYTIEKDGTKSVTMWFDGQLLGKVTKGITAEEVHFVLQNETLLGNDPIPAKMGEARVLTDWLVVEVPA